MSLYRPTEGRRGRKSKINKLIDDLYREGKCRECSVKVTRMDFAKILGKFTKVKIQYESTTKPEPAKKITSPVGNTRLKSNENGMVLIHRTAYREHPAKPELMTSPAPRKRGRPPKNKPVVAPEPPITQYRIVFYERRDSQETASQPTDVNVTELLSALTSDVLPTAEWLMDYLLHDEPTNDRVYDRIAAELEDLMNDKQTSADASATSESKGDDFPSIMELLSDPVGVGASDNKENSDNAQNKDKTEETKNEQTDSVTQESKSTETKNVTQDKTESMEVDTPIASDAREVADKTKPATLVNGNTALIGENTVNVESINYIIFKKVKDDKCDRLVKCSRNLNYSIEIDGRPVELLGAPKYVSCVDDIRLMLQIVDECDLNSFNVVQGG